MADTKVSDIASQIVALREQVSKNQALRATAEANLNHARRQLEQIDRRLTEYGIAPDNVEQELKALETEFENTAAKLRKDLISEAKTYNEIIEQTTAVTGAPK